MSRILCSIGSASLHRRTAVAIPVAIWIPADEWQALADWSRHALSESDHPGLTGLLSGAFPRSFELEEYPSLRGDFHRIPTDRLEGLAAAAANRLGEFFRKASEYIDDWNAMGWHKHYRLGVVFAMYDDGEHIMRDA